MKDSKSRSLHEDSQEVKTRGLVFSYAGPKQLQQARMEAIQLRINERLNATLLKNKDLGYVGLETCASEHDDSAQGSNTRASLFPKHNNMEGSIEQFRSLVIPPALSKKGEELYSSAKFVMDGQQGLFQQASKGNNKSGQHKSVNTSYIVNDQDEEEDLSGRTEAGSFKRRVERVSSAKSVPSQKEQHDRSPSPILQRQPEGSWAGGGSPQKQQPDGNQDEADKQEPRVPARSRLRASGADDASSAAANNVSKGLKDERGSSSPKAKPKVDEKLLRTLKSSVAAPFVPVSIAAGIVPSRGLSTTAGVIGAVRKSVVDGGAVMRPLTSQAANTLQTRMLQSGPQSANSKERMSYVGGTDIAMPAALGARQARAKAEEQARASAPLVKVEEVDVVQESRQKATSRMLAQQLRRSASMTSNKGMDNAATDGRGKVNGQYEPVDLETLLARSSQAAVAQLLEGLIAPKDPSPIPGFDGHKRAASQSPGRKLSLDNWHAAVQKLRQAPDDVKAAIESLASQQQDEGNGEKQEVKQGLHGRQSHQNLEQQQQQQQQHSQQYQQHLMQEQQHHPDAAQSQLPASLMPLHAPILTPQAHNQSMISHQQQLPQQHPWPQPQMNTWPPLQSHAHTQHAPTALSSFQLHADAPSPFQSHSALQRPSATSSPSHSRYSSPSFRLNQSPVWHLASAQLPRTKSARPSPRSRGSSPTRRHPVSASVTTPPRPAVSQGMQPQPPATSQQAAVPASSSQARPASAHIPNSGARPPPALPSPSAPATHILQSSSVPSQARPLSSATKALHRKRPASAAASTARPPWGTSLPRPSSATNLSLSSKHGRAHQGAEAGPMYNWQLTGSPVHRHPTPLSYSQRTSFPDGPDPRSLLDNGTPAKRPHSASASRATPAAGSLGLPSPGMEPPSTGTRVALVQQLQPVIPSRKTANKQRNPAYAQARAAQPPINSTPRYPFLSSSPGAPISASPTIEPWAASLNPSAAMPAAQYSASPQRVAASGGQPNHSEHTGSPVWGQVSVTGSSASRPPSTKSSMVGGGSSLWDGGVIHNGEPAAMQKLGLPLQAEDSWGPQAESHSHRGSNFKSHPLLASVACAPSYHNFRHNPHPQQPPARHGCGSWSGVPMVHHVTLDHPPASARAHTHPGEEHLFPTPSPRPSSADIGSPSSPTPWQPCASGNSGAHPRSAVVFSPSGAPSKRVRPPSAGFWSRSLVDSRSGSSAKAAATASTEATKEDVVL